MNTLPLFVLAYGTVFSAELLGDKTVLSISTLTARYPTRAVLLGLLPAQMVKMAAAVLFGHWLMGLPHSLVLAVSAITFALTAIALWRRGNDTSRGTAPPLAPRPGWHGAVLGFSTTFFTEWADVGQIAAAALVSHYGSPWIVWSAATAAIMTKGVLAAVLGRGLTRFVPGTALRGGVVVVCLLLAIASVLSLD
ncbi:MAG: TMEM165/GDT1 family protein [Gemmatimonadales bacterium]